MNFARLDATVDGLEGVADNDVGDALVTKRRTSLQGPSGNCHYSLS